jgi:hypothetical protein
MKLTLRDGLLFVPLTVLHRGHALTIPDIVVDTGSASTLLSADYLARIDITPEPHDTLYTIRGVGGAEVVFSRRVEQIQAGTCVVNDFEVEVGGVGYGFEINGILGTDFLLRTQAVIDLRELRLVLHV